MSQSIKISCPTFTTEISLKFIISTIAVGIYLNFTPVLLNIYHSNGWRGAIRKENCQEIYLSGVWSSCCRQVAECMFTVRLRRRILCLSDTNHLEIIFKLHNYTPSQLTLQSQPGAFLQSHSVKISDLGTGIKIISSMK